MFTDGFIKGLKALLVAGFAAAVTGLVYGQTVLQQSVNKLNLTPTVVVAPTTVPTASPSATLVPTVAKKIIAPVVSKGVVK